MGGGLMQLVAYGAQDVYLSGNPQITFFKVVYRRHTNFSVEPIPQTWNGVGEFGRTVTCNINRNGDLITNMYLVAELAETKLDNNTVSWGYVRRLGHALVQSAKVEIGGSQIDMQYGDWLNVWYELTHKTGQEHGYAQMIGDTPALKTLSVANKPATTLYVPLQFWFNRNNGLALPLIALQYHDVRITVVLNDRMSCVNWVGKSKPALGPTGMDDCYLLIDYVYLDSEERKRFAQASHEYLIEQLQYTGVESLSGANNKYRLNFNHPCKFLAWVPHMSRHLNGSQWLAYGENGDWSVARDTFAKLIALSAQKTLAVAADGKVTAHSTHTTGSFALDSTFATTTAPLPPALKALFEKVDVHVLNAVVDTSSAELGDTVSLTLNNLSVLRNELTMEDLSLNVEDVLSVVLKDAPAANKTAIQSFIDVVAVNVQDQFNYGNYVDGTDNPVYNGRLQLNGHDRFQDRDGNYFNYVQPYQHFSNTPCDGVNVYSFALKPEDHQPTGSCNFSRIDNATLIVDCGQKNRAFTSNGFKSRNGVLSDGSVLNIYTVNYNVLRVMSGMAGTAYSN